MDTFVARLAPFCDARDLQRLEQLAELAHGYQELATLRPADFVRYACLRKVEAPLSAPIRVMTIHQAKGLQFDIVVLPELDKPLRGHTPRVLVHRPTPKSPPSIVCRYVNRAERALLPEILEPMAEAQKRGPEKTLSLFQ